MKTTFISSEFFNRSFARSGRILQNKLFWDANNAVGLPKQRNFYQSSPTFLSFESPTALFASQYWGPLLSRQIKDKVITLANHKGHWQSSEPIKLQANTCRWRKARETVRWWVTIGLVLHLMDLESGARFFVNRLTQQSKAKACENYFKQKPQNINGREKYLRLDVYQTAARVDKKGKD